MDLDESPYQRQVFAAHIDARRRLLEALAPDYTLGYQDECGPEELATRKLYRKLSDCCRSPLVYIDDEADRLWLSEQRCRSRICPRCGKSRSWQLVARVDELVKQMNSPRFVTLTLRSSDAPLRDQLHRLQTCFARIRRSKTWKGAFLGGVSTVEVTFNPERRQWHPHLHLIADGSYIPKHELSEAWHTATGDSSIVDIRLLHSRSEIVRYLIGYVTKGSNTAAIPDDKLPTWANAIHGLRLVNTFGTTRRLRPEPEDFNARSSHEFADYLSHLQAQADKGDVEAAAIVAAVLAPLNATPPPGFPARLRTWLRQGDPDHPAAPLINYVPKNPQGWLLPGP
jgi:hypothetical protein